MFKKVKLDLVGLDGNAFVLMGTFSKQAKKEGWSKEEIEAVTNKCMEGDYNHLLATLMEHCDDGVDFDDEKYDLVNNYPSHDEGEE